MAAAARLESSLRGDRALPGLAVAVAAVALVATGGLRGVPIAAALVGVWRLAEAPYTFAVGQVGLVVGLDGGLTATATAQAALIATLVVDVVAGRPTDVAVETVGVTGAAAGGLLAVYLSAEGTILTAGLLLVATGLAVYTVHRYERLALDLVGEPT